jgi:D-arabinose 1-dehydrogenase-like Zn-dependent alcohol dehydrogenase
VFSLGGTAHYLAHDTDKLRPGMSCLIHAGAGGLGHLLIQFAKMLGAAALTTVGSEEKAKFVRELDADKAILDRTTDFLTAVRAWGDGKGVDVVYDSVGGRQATIDRLHGAPGRRDGIVRIAPQVLAVDDPVALLEVCDARPDASHDADPPPPIGSGASPSFSLS